MAITLHKSFAIHPGAWLKDEIVGPSGLSVTDLASRLGISRAALSALLNARANLSAEMAIRFEQAFGLSADTLLRMQSSHDIAEARTKARSIKVEPVEMAA